LDVLTFSTERHGLDTSPDVTPWAGRCAPLDLIVNVIDNLLLCCTCLLCKGTWSL